MQVFGISFDDVASQAAFAKAQKLSYRLLSDPDGGVANKYQVAMGGRPFAQRVTFVIDDEGVLRAIERKVDVTNHGSDLMDLIEDLMD